MAVDGISICKAYYTMGRSDDDRLHFALNNKQLIATREPTKSPTQRARVKLINQFVQEQERLRPSERGEMTSQKIELLANAFERVEILNVKSGGRLSKILQTLYKILCFIFCTRPFNKDKEETLNNLHQLAVDQRGWEEEQPFDVDVPLEHQLNILYNLHPQTADNPYLMTNDEDRPQLFSLNPFNDMRNAKPNTFMLTPDPDRPGHFMFILKTVAPDAPDGGLIIISYPLTDFDKCMSMRHARRMMAGLLPGGPLKSITFDFRENDKQETRNFFQMTAGVIAFKDSQEDSVRVIVRNDSTIESLDLSYIPAPLDAFSTIKVEFRSGETIEIPYNSNLSFLYDHTFHASIKNRPSAT